MSKIPDSANRERPADQLTYERRSPMTEVPLNADVRLEGFSIRARSIDLGQEWRRIHSDMLDVVVWS